VGAPEKAFGHGVDFIDTPGVYHAGRLDEAVERAIRSPAAERRTASPITQQECKREIKRSGSQPSGKGPADYFTGTVRIDPGFQAKDPARALGVSVTFEPLRSDSVAHAPAGPDPDRDRRLRSCTTLGRPDRGNSAG
jgi:hypothetical protein